MRLRNRWWLLSVWALLGTSTGVYAQHDPLAFTSLGTLNVTSGTLTINTDNPSMSGAAAFTGLAVNQSGGPQLAVFDFNSITIGSGVTVSITGTRPLVLLSRGNTTIAANLSSTSQLGGYAGGSATISNAGGGIVFSNSSPGNGPGGGGTFANTSGNLAVGGGGFGGAGGGAFNGTNYGGSTYGNIFQTLQGGSGGGAGTLAFFSNGTATATGGMGGGAIEVTATGTVAVAGITLNGASGTGTTNTGSVFFGGGGGAGGAILLYGAGGVSATGSLIVNGGNGIGSSGFFGSGGGGRIGIGGLSTYTLGNSPPGFSTGLSGASQGVITVDALSTTVPSGFSITLNGTPVLSIPVLSFPVEAYVRKDLVINSGGTATLGMDNALKRLDSSGNNVTALTVNGIFNTGAFGQVVSSLTGSGAINLNTGGSITAGENNASSTFAGTTAGNGGLTKIGSGTLTLSGTIGHTGATTIQAGTLELAFPIGPMTLVSPVGGAGSLIKSGGSTITLSSNNTYTGATVVNAGTLRAGSTTAFGSNSAVTVNSGTTLDLNGFNVAIGSLAGNGTVQGNSSQTLTVGSNNAPSTIFGGSIFTSLSKVGTGDLTLAGPTLTAPLSIDGGSISLGTSQSQSTSTRIGPAGTLFVTANGITVGKIDGIGSSSLIQILVNNTSLGNPAAFNGFNHQGTLAVGSNTVTLNSLGFAQLGSLTTLSGGTINATNGVAFGSGSNFDGNGTVNAKISAQQGSIINASGGSLSLGSNSTPAGFITAGELRTNANSVTLNSSSRATLGSLTTLGSGGSPGLVTAANGVLVDFGNSLIGYGTVNTPNNLIQRSIINGTVQGSASFQPVTFTGWIKGVGTYNNVVFSGTFDPGFSPTLITAGSIGFSSTNNLIMELGGLTRGSQFDGIDATGNVNLDGALSITRINGFNPNTADAFVLINRTGGTGTFTGLNEGDSFHGTDGGTYVISYQGINYMNNMMAPGANGFSVVIAAVPEPTTWVLIGLGVAGCSWAGYRRFRNGKSILDAEVIVPD